MKRLLTEQEIENILDFIQPQKGIPHETALSICNANKDQLRSQLRSVQVYPAIIPKLKKRIKKEYKKSLIQPGESVGVLCAQSIGEQQTQMTLNSVDWKEKLLYNKNSQTTVEPIGQMIDRIIECNPENITHIEENRTEYVPLEDGYYTPSCDENGETNWYKIEAVTRHLPVGKLVKVVTASGRSVTATQSKSFLVWDGKKFEPTKGSDVKVGDVLPTTHTLQKPANIQQHFDMSSIFPKDEYIYTSEIVKARELKCFGRKKWTEMNGKDFILPYKRPDTCFGKRRDFFMACKPGFIYLHKANGFVSHIPDKIPLDNDFGFFVGLYLAEGWVTKTFLGISNNDEQVRKRITDFCDRYGVTYHLVTSNGKNVRKGVSNDLKVHSVLLARLFKNICDTGSENKRVPEFAYTAPDEFIKGLINGYYTGDGSVNKKDGSVNASSVSENLILGISFLLSYYGIFGRQSNHQQLKNNVGSKNIKRTYRLCISNGFAQQFARKFHLTESSKQEKLQTVTLAKNYRYSKGRLQKEFPDDRDVYFDEVVSVEFVDGSTEYVYDLTVEETRNFSLFNGLNLMDTFHRAGQGEKTVTTGVPRFQELLNATKSPKSVNCKIYFDRGNGTIQELRSTVGHSFVGLTMKDLSNNISIALNKEPEPWYEIYKVLYNDEFSKYQNCLIVELDINKMFQYKLTAEEIVRKIENEYEDLKCVYSPKENRIDVFVDTSNIVLPESRILYINEDNAVEIYLQEVVKITLEKLYVCGIPGINNIFYTKEGEEWMVETDGSNFRKLLSHPLVNMSRVISNNVWEIYENLGIEAAREFLVEEFMSIMNNINICHTKLLVERMTYSGTISSISRYTMRKEEAGPYCKASFEETMETFLKAAAAGDVEPTKGVSSSIICGKKANIGTGMMDIQMDLSSLPSSN